MKEYASKDIRNVALIGHGASGKTMTGESMLRRAGMINRLGSIEEGTTISDHNSDEIDRQISIHTSLLHAETMDVKFNILDTPGYSDFVGEVKGALAVVDTAVLVVHGVTGVEIGTEMTWRFAKEWSRPRVLFVNMLDKEHADYDGVLAKLQERFGREVFPIQFPINQGPDFNAVIDLVKMKKLSYAADENTCVEEPIPDEFQEKAEEMHQELIELVAESDDTLLEKFFEDAMTEEDLREGLHKAIVENTVFPVLCGSAVNNIGTWRLLEFLAKYTPAPTELPPIEGTKDGETVEVTCDSDEPAVAFVFKTVSEEHVGDLSYLRVYRGSVKHGDNLTNTTRSVKERLGQIFILNGKKREEVERVYAGDILAAVKLKNTHTNDTLTEEGTQVELPKIKFPEPVIRSAIRTTNKGDEDKLSTGLSTMHEEDPTFRYEVDSELSQTIISGLGELHLENVVDRIRHRFDIEVELEEPRIPYRETIRKTAEKRGKFKKQSGGRGQYGDAHVRIEPVPRGEGFEFVDAIVGGVIPTKFVLSVEKGIREAMEEGVIAGYKVVDVRATAFDGSHHSVDSSDVAFKVAGAMAFRGAFKEANPILLEPIYDVEVTVPEEYMGDVMGDISGRRGKIQGMDSDGHFQVIKAKIPLANLYKYSTTLRSITAGRGMHRRKFSHYDPVPAEIQQEIVEKSNQEKEEE
ncbi:MAG: elongation factor G [Candidatus Marinimicrobia bacterium]|nr:elongation factor G [Candidatus Neomarinimicrobiota bacterium]MCF7828683.1 elongation factor G [Candidatus Neomarinimicrobiota bacterium]MCF7880424.1 elongation factor G [Candidatus Neomarinimicrobiota bacterium]